MTPALDAPAPQQLRAVADLRQDLRLIEGPRDPDGARRWLIYDPLQHRFFSIGETAHVLLQLWRGGATVEGLVEAAWARFAVAIDATDILSFETFLFTSGLTVNSASKDGRGFFGDYLHRRKSILMTVIHGYVFFRMPLFDPDRFLERTLPYVRILGTRYIAAVVAIAALIGIYLVSREWDAFLSTFVDVFTFQGLAMTAVSLVFLKVLHELAHGYTAKHFGCHVPIMGVAFILAFPLLYTDVTDAWRLKSRRDRLLVGGAGILMDLSVSCLAIFAWAFLPPGAAKSVAFSLATTAWVLSLVMNLNPLMKFDGYHLLADFLGMENLHPRAIAVARWRLREMLFHLRHPPPEPMSKQRLNWLCVLGYAIWLYRLVLFTSIALAVYAFFFKAIGIILFLVEIIYFIVGPIWNECREWFAMRRQILSSRRTLATGCVLLFVFGALIVPWSSTVRIPAVLEAGGLLDVHPSAAARIAAIHVSTGQLVEKDARMISLAAPLLHKELLLTEKKLAVIELRQSRRVSDASDREAGVILEQENAALSEKRSGLLRRLAELEVVAPYGARIAEMQPALQIGQWVNVDQSLLLLRTEGSAQVRGLVDAADVWRLQSGLRARFVPNDFTLPVLDVQISSIASTSTHTLDQIELVANFGGQIPARLDAQGRAVPETAQYAVRASINGSLPFQFRQKTVPGVVLGAGLKESLLARGWRQALSVLVRESGF